MHWGCGSLVLEWSFVLGPPAGRSTEPSGRSWWKGCGGCCESGGVDGHRPGWGSTRQGDKILPPRESCPPVFFFLGGTIFCCCKVGVIGENIENCRRTPRERIWRVSLVFGNLTDIAIAPSNMISLGRRSMLYFWGWSLFRGQNSSPFRASVAAASLDKILQVSPCGFNKASPTTRDSQGQLNQAEDWGPSFFI